MFEMERDLSKCLSNNLTDEQQTKIKSIADVGISEMEAFYADKRRIKSKEYTSMEKKYA